MVASTSTNGEHTQAHKSSDEYDLHAHAPQLFRSTNDNFLHKTPKSRLACEEARKYMPGGSTRSSLWSAPYSLTFSRGSGSTITDLDGCTYDDFLCEYTAGLFGHNNPQIKAAIQEALESGWNFGGQSQHEQALAKAVVERFSPAMEMVRFTNSGTEANTMALAAALAWHHVPVSDRAGRPPKNKIIVFEGGYHGGTLGFPKQDTKVAHVSTPPDNPINLPHNFIVAPFNDIDAFLVLAKAHAESLAGILIEPMQGNAGARPNSPELLYTLRKICDESGALLIFDEVQTSRFGLNGLGQKMGVKADLMTVGKWVGGGMTFGAFGGRKDVMSMFDLSVHSAQTESLKQNGHISNVHELARHNRKTGLQHAGTFNNNVVSMAAGLAGLKIATPEALEALNARGDKFRDRMMTLLREKELGTDDSMWVTGMGSILSVRFGGRWKNELPRAYFQFMLEQGIYFSPRGFMALSLEVTDRQIDSYVAALEKFVDAFRSVLLR